MFTVRWAYKRGRLLATVYGTLFIIIFFSFPRFLWHKLPIFGKLQLCIFSMLSLNVLVLSYLYFNKVGLTNRYQVSIVLEFFAVPRFHQSQAIYSSLTLNSKYMLVNSYPVGHVVLNSGWHRMCPVSTIMTTAFFIY